jgi:GH25 family lysozyme M1 (1,4-beta-N-acetylmuramidase)
MTIFYPDISGWQAGIDLKGALAVGIKATEGTGYTNPDYNRAKGNAHDHGAFPFAYHFMTEGNAAAQARHCHGVVGDTPVMIDVEWSALGGNPTLRDTTTFIDAFRKLGGTTHLVYLPQWYWERQGSPSLKPLSNRHMRLVSSNYKRYTDESNGPGWVGYGGMTPTVWQYSSSVPFNGKHIDFNAYRGSHPGQQGDNAVAATLKQFKSIVNTGQFSSDDDTQEDTQTWREWKTAGKRSLAEIAEACKMAPSTILRTTANHYGEYDKVLAAYVNDMVGGNGTAASKIPAGATLWVRK